MQSPKLKLYRGSYYAVWRDARGTRRAALRTKNREEALAALKALAEKPGSMLGPTVADAYHAYLQDKERQRPKDAWKRLMPFFAQITPEQVDRPTCRRYIAARREAGAGDGTISTELIYLRAALRFVNPNTPAVIEMPPKPPPRSDHLTPEQYDALLAAATTPHVRLFIILALATAGRMTALLELTWEQVDFERGQIRLGQGVSRLKGRATVPMTRRAREALEQAAKARQTDFVIEYGGKPVTKIRKAFARAAERGGIPWVTPHVLRHTAAVWMAEAGVPMAQIAQVLGHTNTAITERVYARFSPDFLRSATAVLDR
ncbi:MAG: site-specific integrase [Rhodospirillales bacterium]|nr:site-specific integrase [Rhodospirillales bacterium]